MEDNDKIQNESLKLEKAYTFFMIPFYYEGVSSPILKDDPLWEKETDKVSNEGEDGDILYPYIMNFLQGQMNPSTSEAEHLEIYRLKIQEDSERHKIFWKPFTDAPSTIILKEKKSGIRFRILSGINQGFRSPHLFVSSSSQIGILCFCVEIAEKEKTIDDLKLLNYYLHKLHQPLAECSCSALKINPKMQFKDDDESTAEQKKKNKEKSLINARAYLKDDPETDIYTDFIWTIRDLVDMWLGTYSCMKLFSMTRAHLFTYCQIDDSKEEKLEIDAVLPDMLRLSRCVNDKYQLDFQNEINNGCLLKTFANIYVASSVEGAVIMAIAKENNKGFISNMDSSVRLRYLWVYLLSIIQRYSMQNLNRRLIERELKMTDTELQKLFDVIQKVKVYCYYTDVSPYSQHNQFYQHCCRNLHVEESYNEIERKAAILTQTISKRAQDKAESKQRQLNIVVSILTIFQVGDAIFTLTNRDATDNLIIPVCGMVLFVFVICIIYYKDIFVSIKRIFN